MTSSRPPIGAAEDAIWRDRIKSEELSEEWHKSPRAHRLYMTEDQKILGEHKRHAPIDKYSHMNMQGTSVAAWFKNLESPRQKAAAIKSLRRDLGMERMMRDMESPFVTLSDETAVERAMCKWAKKETALSPRLSPRYERPTDGALKSRISLVEGRELVPWRRHDDTGLMAELARRGREGTTF